MDSFYIEPLYYYWGWIILLSLTMRAFFSLLRANENHRYVYDSEIKSPKFEKKVQYFNSLSFWRKFRIIFHGFTTVEPYPDSWYNTAIGTFELYAFPIMMYQDKYSYIGAWLAFKLIGQWKMWGVNRNAANRIVIATIIELLTSYFILINYVH